MAADVDLSRAYYQTMVYRLMVLGGAAARAGEQHLCRAASRQRHDVNGRAFCEVVEPLAVRQPEEAKAAASQRGAGFEAVGLTPWQPAFSVPAITGLKVASEFRDPAQKANESPMIRIFEVVR